MIRFVFSLLIFAVSSAFCGESLLPHFHFIKHRIEIRSVSVQLDQDQIHVIGIKDCDVALSLLNCLNKPSCIQETKLWTFFFFNSKVAVVVIWRNINKIELNYQ